MMRSSRCNYMIICQHSKCLENFHGVIYKHSCRCRSGLYALRSAACKLVISAINEATVDHFSPAIITTGQLNSYSRQTRHLANSWLCRWSEYEIIEGPASDNIEKYTSINSDMQDADASYSRINCPLSSPKCYFLLLVGLSTV
jgi:hypothetical protein